MEHRGRTSQAEGVASLFIVPFPHANRCNRPITSTNRWPTTITALPVGYITEESAPLRYLAEDWEQHGAHARRH